MAYPDHTKQVLLATSSKTESFTFRALKSTFSVHVVSSTVQAHEKLNEPFDVIICGSLFDESRMFDLLRYCKAMPHIKHIPFLCIRARGGELDDTAYQGVAIAAKALGAADFIDLYRWIKEMGPEQAFETLRKVVGHLATDRRNDLLGKLV
jgi:PleD family two-component response regulator